MIDSRYKYKHGKTVSREVPTATAPNHPVPLEQMEQYVADNAGDGGSTAPVEKTGNTIVFTERANYNYDEPVTGDITIDPTGAVKDTVVAFFYNGDTAPEITGADCIMRSGRFTAGKKLIYWFLWFDGGYSLNIQVDNRIEDDPAPEPTGNILLADDFAGTEIDPQWTVTDNGDVVVSQDDALIFTDTMTGSPNVSKVTSIASFDSSSQTLVLKFDAFKSAMDDSNFEIKFINQADIDHIHIRNSAGGTWVVEEILKEGTITHQNESSISETSINNTFKIKLESGVAYFYYWNNEWILLSQSSFNANIYSVEFKRNTNANNGTISQVDDVTLTDYDYSTLNPV